MNVIFNIKSYIKNPNIIIKDLSIINSNHKEIFIELDDDKILKTLVKDIDTDYIEGVIYLEYNGNILMDFRYWDIIDQLWAYMIQLIDDNLKNKEAEVYFPDQPIKLQIKSISNNLVLFCIEENSKIQITLPKYEFFKSILESAKKFFIKIYEYLGSMVDYSYELDLINKLENKLII